MFLGDFLGFWVCFVDFGSVLLILSKFVSLCCFV